MSGKVGERGGGVVGVMELDTSYIVCGDHDAWGGVGEIASVGWDGWFGTRLNGGEGQVFDGRFHYVSKRGGGEKFFFSFSFSFPF